MTDESQSTGETGSRGRPGKVARILETYRLEGVGDELAESWVGESGERRSLRELAEYLNKRLIERALQNAGDDPLPGEVETIYEALMDDDTSPGLTQEVRGRLDRAGVDPDSLESDLVSYQAIRSYLQRDRGVEYDREPTDAIESTRIQIQRLTGRLRAVSEQRLDDLESKDELVLGSYNILVNVQLYCEECGRQYSLETVLDEGGCGCLTESTE